MVCLPWAGCGEQGREMGKSLRLRRCAKACRAHRESDTQRFQGRGRPTQDRELMQGAEKTEA